MGCSSIAMQKVLEKLCSVDVLVVGSGMVGPTFALALSNIGFKVAIIDRIDPVKQKSTQFDGRASAITATSKKMLEQIGVWSCLDRNPTPILDIRVVDGGSPFFLHFDSKEIDCSAFGYMVENQDFRKACLDVLGRRHDIVYLAPAKLISFERDAQGVRATLDNGSKINAKLIVGADGRSSMVRKSAGIEIATWLYDQTAIVLTVDHDVPHFNIAYEHFLPAGPFAILPLCDEKGQNQRSSIVWTEKSHLAETILELNDRDFMDQFELRFGGFLGKATLVGSRWSYPLSSQYAQTSILDRLALLGDAAHGIHPIAGQGLNLGFRDVAALAEVLADARRIGLDIGDIAVLGEYQKWRHFDNTAMLIMTDFTNRLFSNDIGSVKLFRDFGLATINKTGPLKKFFMRHAMGSVGNLPRLLKGKAL